MAGPGDVLKDLQERAQFLLNADRSIAEVVEVLKDTHRILAKLEGIVDRLDETTRSFQDDLRVERIERLEQAVLNIERATLTVEAAVAALPKRMRRRVAEERGRITPPSPH